LQNDFVLTDHIRLDACIMSKPHANEKAAPMN
jgi:hypothetical protein